MDDPKICKIALKRYKSAVSPRTDFRFISAALIIYNSISCHALVDFILTDFFSITMWPGIRP